MSRIFFISILFLIMGCDLFENEQALEIELQEINCDEEFDFYTVVEQMPVLIGGLAELQEKVVYPDIAIRAGIEGRVIVQFIVTENGDVACPRVIRGIGAGCDEAAFRAVSEAKFEPGKQDGTPVRVQYSLPIVFKLPN